MPAPHSFKRTASNKSYKRICALSDGTWKSPESEVPTNVLRLTEAIAQEGHDGVQQVVFYDAGVGGEDTGFRALSTGLTGAGLVENIVQLYTQVALNYDAGDELYLFGFSRGAYTVRSLSGMLHSVGLLRRDQLHLVREAFAAYRSNDASKQKQFRKAHDTAYPVPVDALVCFDTVGALGVPAQLFGFATPAAWHASHAFHDTTVGEHVRLAVHALAIDEERTAFAPTRMAPHPERGAAQLRQMFLRGVHSGVGGGLHDEQDCADAAVRFVVDALHSAGYGLRFHEHLLPDRDGEDSDDGSNKDNKTAARRDAGSTETTADGPPPVSFADRIMRFVAGARARTVDSIKEVHWTAVRHYQMNASYRPPGLAHLHEELVGADWRAMKEAEA